MLALGAGSPAVIQPRYKHLMPEDVLLWEGFLEAGKEIPEAVWYDVRVGTAVEVPSGQPRWMWRMADYATKKRIDIVARYGADHMVIECKPHAGIVALGQVMYYGWALEREYAHEGNILRGIITDSIDEDVEPLLAELGVWVAQVGGG